ncbi:MAG: phosphoribosyl-AMP cyclohydrolase [Fimbriimonadaceae bacterium]|nr:phosphoribosyl-AMP cyclohydrolase [Fimbriimonadaceae bacterium]
MSEQLSPDFAKGGGLVTAIAQDWQDGTILMVAYMNEEAWHHTLQTGHATYWSRSRNKLWLKGESSGNVQKVHEIRVDCDADAVLLKVEQIGDAACHTGRRSCFYRVLREDGFVTDSEPIFDPKKVYGQ